MKVAAGSKNKTRIAIVLGIVAILVVARAVMTSGGPANQPASTTASSSETKKSAQTSQSLDPRLRLDLLENSEKVKYEGKGTNIFRAGAEPVEITKAKISPLLRKQQEDAAVKAHLPPPPPPINLKYFGITNSKGEKPKAFLSQGDDIWIANEGDVVNRRYKIVHISPTGVEVEDLLNNNRQTISITQG